MPAMTPATDEKNNNFSTKPTARKSKIIVNLKYETITDEKNDEMVKIVNQELKILYNISVVVSIDKDINNVAFAFQRHYAYILINELRNNINNIASAYTKATKLLG